MWKRNTNSIRRFILSPQNEPFGLEEAKIPHSSVLEMQHFCTSPCASPQVQAAEMGPTPGQHFSWKTNLLAF